MHLLTSDAIIGKFYEKLHAEGAALVDAGVSPHLAVVLVGSNEDSLRYIDIKTKRGKEVGLMVSVYHLEPEEAAAQLIPTLDYLSDDADTHGIIVQLPVPGYGEKDLPAVFEHIAPEKDVDGLRGDWRSQSYENMSEAELLKDRPFALPPMVASVCTLLNHYQIDLVGKKIVIVGRGVLVGQPLEAFFSAQGLDVQTVDEDTDHILDITKQADVLIAGTGTPNLITYQWVKEGAIVLDCAQDAHRDSVDQVASAVAPATGGLGPLTVTWLLQNTLTATAHQTSTTQS